MRLIVTAGGTGGHIFPALALAEELRSMGHTVLFIGSSSGPEAVKAAAAGFEFLGMDVKGFDRNDIGKALKALFMFPMSVLGAVKAVGVFRPDGVIGCGGYASGPSCIAALLKGVPVFLLEQNVFPGLVTRTLAKMARRVYTSFSGSTEWLKGADVILAGNPVRGDFKAPSARDFNAGEKTLLVMGGSQGARSINRAMVDALPFLKGLKLKIIHQTGAADASAVKAAYADKMPDAVVSPFFDDMAAKMRQAHLAVARAGASTCAELEMTALPALLVPFPGAGGHQKLNAKALEESGAAVVMDDSRISGESLSERIKELLADTAGLEKMSACARENAKPRAAEFISRDIVTILGGA